MHNRCEKGECLLDMNRECVLMNTFIIDIIIQEKTHG